jgi:NTP pyrophosphatase (non-canonical NTP hydrolase)
LDSPARLASMPGMSDSFRQLTARIQAFVDARDWRVYHNPKDLTVAIAAEAGELLQHFVWQTNEQSDRRAVERRDQIADEIADIAILLFELADNLGLGLGDAVAAKLARNEERYPVAKARGNNRKYTDLAEAVTASVGGRPAGTNLTIRRVFQALRIEVNDEVPALQAFLRAVPGWLKPGGRLVVISFHSGEDRRVKQALRAGLQAGTWGRISDRVTIATAAERHANPRSAPAKLRWAVRAGA